MSLAQAEKQAALIAKLRDDHADPEAWAKVEELKARGWVFPGLSRELKVGGFDALGEQKMPPYYASCLSDGISCAAGGTVKELVENVELWEAEQLRRAPELRSKAVHPGYRLPDE